MIKTTNWYNENRAVLDEMLDDPQAYLLPDLDKI